MLTKQFLFFFLNTCLVPKRSPGDGRLLFQGFLGPAEEVPHLASSGSVQEGHAGEEAQEDDEAAV